MSGVSEVFDRAVDGRHELEGDSRIEVDILVRLRPARKRNHLAHEETMGENSKPDVTAGSRQPLCARTTLLRYSTCCGCGRRGAGHMLGAQRRVPHVSAAEVR